MKKFLFCMFAVALIVPTFSGCGGSNEAEIPPDTGESGLGDGMTDDEYEKRMKEGDGTAEHGE